LLDLPNIPYGHTYRHFAILNNLRNITILLPLAVGTANAAVLSINLTNADGPRQILATESTGVINTTGWVNVQSNTAVTDSGVTIAPFGNRSTSNTLRDLGVGDGTDGFLALNEFGLRDSTGANQTDTGVTISGLSQFLTAANASEYRIIAYYKSPIISGNRVIEIGLDSSFTTVDTPDYSNVSVNDNFVQHESADSNYIEFTGLTADSTTLYVNRSNRDGLLTGFQIEAVPEPSTSLLAGLAGIGLLLRRRK